MNSYRPVSCYEKGHKIELKANGKYIIHSTGRSCGNGSFRNETVKRFKYDAKTQKMNVFSSKGELLASWKLIRLGNYSIGMIKANPN